MRSHHLVAARVESPGVGWSRAREIRHRGETPRRGKREEGGCWRGKWGGLFLGYLLGKNYRRRDRDHLVPARKDGCSSLPCRGVLSFLSEARPRLPIGDVAEKLRGGNDANTSCDQRCRAPVEWRRLGTNRDGVLERSRRGCGGQVDDGLGRKQSRH